MWECLFGGASSKHRSLELDMDENGETKEEDLDESLVGKRILLRGGEFNQFTSSANVHGMMALVMSISYETCTYCLSLEDGRLINLSPFELTGFGPKYSNKRRTPCDGEYNKQAMKSYNLGGDFYSQVDLELGNSLFNKSIYEELKVEHNKLHDHNTDDHFYPPGYEPKKKPIYHCGDLVFVRDEPNEPWKPGVVESVNKMNKQNPLVKLYGWDTAYEWSEYRLVNDHAGDNHHAQPDWLELREEEKEEERISENTMNNDGKEEGCSQETLQLRLKDKELNQRNKEKRKKKGLRDIGSSLQLAHESSGDPQWTAALGTTDVSNFKVRASGYKKQKQKKRSESPLYEMYGGDCIVSEGATKDFSSKMFFPPLPSNVKDYDGFDANSFIPSYFVINMQIPTVGKPLFGAKRKAARNGAPLTLNAVYYFRISPASAKIMTYLQQNEEKENLILNDKVHHITNSHRLMYKWFRGLSEGDEVMAGRLKAIGIGHNFEDIGAPGFIKGYNGKPVLFAQPGRANRKGFSKICKGTSYLELDIDVGANFSFLAQKGIVWGLGMSSKMDSSLGFVIEGREEDELPECILACVSTKFVPHSNGAVDFDTMFNSENADDNDGSDDGETEADNERNYRKQVSEEGGQEEGGDEMDDEDDDDEEEEEDSSDDDESRDKFEFDDEPKMKHRYQPTSEADPNRVISARSCSALWEEQFHYMRTEEVIASIRGFGLPNQFAILNGMPQREDRDIIMTEFYSNQKKNSKTQNPHDDDEDDLLEFSSQSSIDDDEFVAHMKTVNNEEDEVESAEEDNFEEFREADRRHHLDHEASEKQHSVEEDEEGDVNDFINSLENRTSEPRANSYESEGVFDYVDRDNDSASGSSGNLQQKAKGLDTEEESNQSVIDTAITSKKVIRNSSTSSSAKRRLFADKKDEDLDDFENELMGTAANDAQWSDKTRNSKDVEKEKPSVLKREESDYHRRAFDAIANDQSLDLDDEVTLDDFRIEEDRTSSIADSIDASSIIADDELEKLVLTSGVDSNDDNMSDSSSLRDGRPSMRKGASSSSNLRRHNSRTGGLRKNDSLRKPHRRPLNNSVNSADSEFPTRAPARGMTRYSSNENLTRKQRPSLIKRNSSKFEL